MKRRQGFTIIELLVSMALIIFIMSILSSAFIAATNTFRNLKALGDMAEKLRGTTQILQHDLAADHFDGKKRLSNPNFWLNGPPTQGFFRIWQGSPSSTTVGSPSYIEGVGIDGIGSYRTVNHALAFTIKLRGDQMGDFLSASGGMAALSGLFGPAEARYQTGAAYNYQWGEVVWFLQPQIEPNTNPPAQDMAVDQAGTLTPTPLYTLYRRQRLLVPDNSLVTPAQPATNMSQFLELSDWNHGGTIYFNGPFDVTVPNRRFGMIRTNLAGVPNVSAYPNVGYPSVSQQLAALGQTNPTLNGSDIQLTDVISFDVRLLISAPGFVPPSPDPFVTLFTPPLTTAITNGGYYNGNPNFPTTGPMVFDTWSSLNDSLGNYSTWNVFGQATSIPLWNGTAGPIIQAIQISIRIWDSKTNQSRQVTIVQAM